MSLVSGPVTTCGGASECCYVGGPLALCAATGRPFVLHGVASTADVVFGAGAGWSEGRAPDVGSLSAADRAALAAAWAKDGLAEHASVAAFARLAVELMMFGAPADLIRRCHAAALDEVRHAKLCFALASAYAGRAVGPSPLPVGGSLPLAATLVELAANSAIEGCIGETTAAAMAAEQLGFATDPAVRAALRTIARDEARHAELGWRIVAWAVRAGGDGVRAAVAEVFARAVCASRAKDPPTEIPRLDALALHGRLDPGRSSVAAGRVAREVIAPASAALLAMIEDGSGS